MNPNYGCKVTHFSLTNKKLSPKKNYFPLVFRLKYLKIVWAQTNLKTLLCKILFRFRSSEAMLPLSGCPISTQRK